MTSSQSSYDPRVAFEGETNAFSRSKPGMPNSTLLSTLYVHIEGITTTEQCE